jgi:hypothetical protein
MLQAYCLARLAGQQEFGLNVILSNKNLIQTMRILGPLLTFMTGLLTVYRYNQNSVPSVLFTEILLSEALARNTLKG